MGIRFYGGTQIQVGYAQSADLGKIREQLVAAGFPEVVVQNYGTSKDVLINIAPRKGVQQQQLTAKLLSVLPALNYTALNLSDLR